MKWLKKLVIVMCSLNISSSEPLDCLSHTHFCYAFVSTLTWEKYSSLLFNTRTNFSIGLQLAREEWSEGHPQELPLSVNYTHFTHPYKEIALFLCCEREKSCRIPVSLDWCRMFTDKCLPSLLFPFQSISRRTMCLRPAERKIWNIT